MEKNDTLVLVEWYDNYIPPRRHVLVLNYGTAKGWQRNGASVQIHRIDPEVLRDERTTKSEW